MIIIFRPIVQGQEKNIEGEIKRKNRGTYRGESSSPAIVPITTGTIYFNAKKIIYIRTFK